jgi:hypothetical protein
VVIQNRETIVAGSFNGYNISSFSRDPLLDTVLAQDSIQSRIVDYDQQPTLKRPALIDIAVDILLKISEANFFTVSVYNISRQCVAIIFD